jgi:hypothetical protein
VGLEVQLADLPVGQPGDLLGGEAPRLQEQPAVVGDRRWDHLVGVFGRRAWNRAICRSTSSGGIGDVGRVCRPYRLGLGGRGPAGGQAADRLEREPLLGRHQFDRGRPSPHLADPAQLRVDGRADPAPPDHRGHHPLEGERAEVSGLVPAADRGQDADGVAEVGRLVGRLPVGVAVVGLGVLEKPGADLADRRPARRRLGRGAGGQDVV